MGRFSKLEPNQPAPNVPEPHQPTLEGRLQPGELGAAGEEDNVPRTASEWLDLGDLAALRGDFKPALRWYSRALDKDTTLLEGWVSMIRVLLLQGDLGQAETWTNRALTLFPGSGKLLAMRAVVLARRGILQQAINNSDAILTQNAADPVAHVARGEVLLLADNKNYEFCFTQAVKMVPPGDWKTPASIAMVFEDRRLWARAIQFFTLAAERNESCAALHYRIACCRAELGQTQQARRALEQAYELCPAGDPLLLKINHARTGSVWNRMLGLFRKK